MKLKIFQNIKTQLINDEKKGKYSGRKNGVV